MVFKPKYTITEKILNNLTLIATAREVVEQTHLEPRWEALLHRQAKVRNTHSSTAIEGNNLTFEQVEALVEDQDVIAAEKDKKEVLNYLEALEAIPSLAVKGRLSVEDLLTIHRLASKDVLPGNRPSGVFRDRQVFVGRRVFDGTVFRSEVVYMPPKTEDVPNLAKEFIAWLNLEKTWQTNPVFIAGIAHYEIARIHPFIDGNGRTTRLLAALIFHLSGFDRRRLFSFDEYYDQDRPAYYSALKTVQDKNGDITEWLEYFTTGVAFSVNEVKEAVLKLGVRKKPSSKSQIALSERQMKIVEFINAHGKVKNKDLQALFKISAQAVHKEFARLVDRKIIRPVGAGRAVNYVLR